ncbi:hypothetical protein [Vibrio mangrovi]|uniref:Uncharacterized protein n=1 Tax=Vibrio mangrovi TaxID=474394 RepID=A0A1Y6IV80_9VIBR|nr:hypothetical protein [Vibrio mangrovi]MDW6002193.1 hypothetical protein [Vibrio mangrovi]SMS01538.1 hypothetical protein VIM7927_02834 [Vibrio mangrovi]
MKVAIQLYGHLRTFEKCAVYLKEHILDYYDCDVFIHTWDTTEHVSKSWYDESVKSSVIPVDEYILNKIDDLYSPRKIKIETQNLFNEPESYGTHEEIQISLQGLKYMLYSQYQVNNLRLEYEKENGIVYDYVVMIRPDVMPFLKLDFNLYQPEFEYNKNISIHFLINSELFFISDKVFNYPLVSDVYYFSTPGNMNKITSVFERFDYFYKDIVSIFPKNVENPEVSFFESIIQNGVIPRQYLGYFAIKRKDDFNDIKRLPPNEHVINYKESYKKRFVKLILNQVNKYMPEIVKRKLIRLFLLLGACANYIQVNK